MLIFITFAFIIAFLLSLAFDNDKVSIILGIPAVLLSVVWVVGLLIILPNSNPISTLYDVVASTRIEAQHFEISADTIFFSSETNRYGKGILAENQGRINMEKKYILIEEQMELNSRGRTSRLLLPVYSHAETRYRLVENKETK